jgi:diguanylate cyclase (GGDEF)-like protein
VNAFARYGFHAMLGASIAVYALGWASAYALVGPVVGALAVVPIMIAAWYFTLPAVVVVAAICAIVNAFSLITAGDPVSDAVRSSLIAAAAFTLVGTVLSYARGAQRRVARLMATDAETGLLTRAAFVRSLDEKMRHGTHAVSDLVVIDIIHFRQISETFGHEMGDELLRAIGQRLRSNAEGDDRVARIGSDKFLIWLRAGTTPLAIGRAVHVAMTDPFRVARTEVRLEARVAVARHPDHADNAQELLRRAEIALDEARTMGRLVSVATGRSEQERLSRLDTFTGLRAAIANGELRLHYQPIVDLPGRSVSGVEALVRWQHPERGLLAPGEFIAVAEQSGLIVPLTKWVLNEALRQARVWSDEGRAMRVAINVGAKSLTRSAALPSMVGELLRSHGVLPELVALEVTESDVMTDPEQAIACLHELKALGVRIEIDDFGTGYSSLAYLQKLPLDAVKIDRSFITPLFVDAGTSAIVRAAIELSHALGLETTAEGVEDEPVVKMLGAMGCDFAQGYVFARPMPAEKLEGWIAARALYALPEPALPARPIATVAGAPGRTVLVVDDEHPFRVSAHRILTAQGFNVLHAATASEALRLCATHRGDIDLVLTDLFLTDWQGHKLATHLRDMYPELRVMFMSGDPAGNQLVGEATFLTKPFSRQQLVAGVSEALAS